MDNHYLCLRLGTIRQFETFTALLINVSVEYFYTEQWLTSKASGTESQSLEVTYIAPM